MGKKIFKDTDEYDDETSVVTKSDVKIQEPSMYRVLLHNDDYTPMDFVVDILESVFSMKHPQATQIMMDVHQKGIGICGVYTYEIAETKVAIVTESARKEEHPLKCTMEQA
jgi:ATP-dependent Clp protease adaptor protein ClpS